MTDQPGLVTDAEAVQWKRLTVATEVESALMTEVRRLLATRAELMRVLKLLYPYMKDIMEEARRNEPPSVATIVETDFLEAAQLLNTLRGEG